MNMGIERVLKEKFGDAFKEIRQVFDGDNGRGQWTDSTTVDIAPSQYSGGSLSNTITDWQADPFVLLQAVNRHLDILRPAIANYGGSVDVLAVDGEDCLVRYDGPESIGSGIKAAIKEKFPDITSVVFTL
jgi:NFU1 iron-sulfur cluster scaffold homolog, mitochondrial